MDQRRLRQASDIGDASGRSHERRAAVAQMLAGNREALGMKVIAVIVLTRELWDLNSISDMGAGRGNTYNENVSKAMLESITSNSRYSIVNLTIGKDDVSHKVTLPSTLRRLNIMAERYDYPLDLPATLLVLSFDQFCRYNQPLGLPMNLQKLLGGNLYSHPLTLPSTLVELELGSAYTHPLILPRRLKRLSFALNSQFNRPLALPSGLLSIQFGNWYDQATILPYGIEEIRVGAAFAHDVALPSTLRRIQWRCNHAVQLPEGVVDAQFWVPFNNPVTLPASLKKAAFVMDTYSHPLTFPAGLEELNWYVAVSDGLVLLPAGLQKLTWTSDRHVDLPSGLKELSLIRNTPLIMPDGLLKVSLTCWSGCHFHLPGTVEELTYHGNSIFTHPTTLQHLTIEYSNNQLDLSHIRIHKLSIDDCGIMIRRWPQGLKELEFTVDVMDYPLRVPQGCRIVGEKRPVNVIME